MTLEVQLHQLPLRSTTNNGLLHTEHLQRHDIFVFIAQFPRSVSQFWLDLLFCVYPWIDSGGKNKFVIYPTSAHLHLHYHRQFKQCSNSLEHYRPSIPWSLDWEHHYWPSPCLDSTTLHTNLSCLHITYHISQSSWPYSRKNHTHGRWMSSNPQ